LIGLGGFLGRRGSALHNQGAGSDAYTPWFRLAERAAEQASKIAKLIPTISELDAAADRCSKLAGWLPING
jgi:hypothetical protein